MKTNLRVKRLIRTIAAFLLLCLLLCLITAIAADYEDLDDDVIGYCGSTLTATRTQNSSGAKVIETSLGNLTADALLEYCGADIAITAGGHFVWNLAGGAITASDIHQIFKDEYEVGVIYVTPAELWEVLEYAVSYIQIGEDELIDIQLSEYDGFPQIAGFSMTYDASQMPGDRVKKISLDKEGEELDKNDTETSLMLAAPVEMIYGNIGFNISDDTRISITGTEVDALIDYVCARETIQAPATNRISVLGTYDNSIAKKFNIAYLIPLVMLLIILIRLPQNRHRQRNMDGTFSTRYLKL